MNTPVSPAAVSSWSFRSLKDAMKKHCRWWLWPTVILGVISFGYAFFFKTDAWKASQSLMVRDEAVGNLARLGRFNTNEAQKSAQETILEVSKNTAVVTAALLEAGPPPGCSAANSWPSPQDIANAQAAISVVPPNGAEFGSTEMLRLEVKAGTAQRAVALADAVFHQMDVYLQQVRNRRAESIMDELQKTLTLAEADREAATKRLQAMEQEVGSDLGELRTLSESMAGESHLRTTSNQIKSELRQARSVQDANREKHKLLTAALADPNTLVATPNQLLETQPSLRKLKEGLIDAQLRAAELASKLSPDHPIMQAALAAEQEHRQKLQGEVENALRGLDGDMVINDNLVASLEKQLADVNKRMDRLAGLRARYSNLASEVHNRTETVERAHAALAEAAASQSAAKTASLLTRLDRPETGERPLGPSRAVIALGGTFCGFAAGLGLMFLAMPIGGRLQGRRWSDYVHFGRRATDRASGRRAEDQTKPPTNEEVIYARRAEDVSVGRRTEDKTGGRGENRPLNLFGDNSTQNPFPQDVNPPAAPKP